MTTMDLSKANVASPDESEYESFFRYTSGRWL
jgi:hypothetical protein